MEGFDQIDERIIRVLQDNSRLNTKEIAHKVGLTVTPTYERLKKIDKSGIIKGYVTLMDRERLGKGLAAFCHVTLQVHSLPLLKTFEQAMSGLDEVMECYHVAGTYDYLLKVVVRDMNKYQDFLTNKLAAIENIAHVHSLFVMTEIKHTTAYTIDH